tara:strand:+ start:688 stop:1248 length:561 start_codon:yes stop_codon:yes gene_type:complete
MNNQTLVIYDFKILYEILYELKFFINFNIINVDKTKNLKPYNKESSNFLLVSNRKIKDSNNQLEITNFPIEITKLIENISIKFLKNRYVQQSDIIITGYKLNLNSRKISFKSKSLNLTERETNILIFLNKVKKPVTINKMQTEVWGHNFKLETHTVETHIYRLRKKIKEVFNDDNFIKSSKLGYSI